MLNGEREIERWLFSSFELRKKIKPILDSGYWILDKKIEPILGYSFESLESLES